MASAGVCVALTVTVVLGDVVGPDEAVATFVTLPVSRSAWVTV